MPQPLPNVQTGQNPQDPLTQLNGYIGFGLMARLNLFSEIGLNSNDPNVISNDDKLARALTTNVHYSAEPAVVEQVIAMDPHITGSRDVAERAVQEDDINPEQLRQICVWPPCSNVPVHMFDSMGLFAALPEPFSASGEPNPMRQHQAPPIR